MQPTNPLFKIIGAIIFALFGLTIVFGSWYTVDEGERVVVTRNGAVVAVTDPGLHFKTPWLDSTHTFEVRTQKYGSFSTAAYSKDIQNATYGGAVNYRVDPGKVKEIYSNLGTGYSDRIIGTTVYRVLKEQAGKYNAAEIVNQRDRLGDAITTALAEELLPYGILVDQVQLENVDFDDSFEHAIAARMKAEVEVQQQKQVLEKQKVEAETVKVNADAQAYATKQKAEAEAFRITATMDAEAKGITKRGDALRANQQLVELVKAEKWDGKLPTTMLPNGVTPMIDLRNN